MLKKLLKKYMGNKIAANILVVAIITVAVKVLGFFKEIVIAGEFGLSELLDTFYIALLIPGLINQVFLVSFKSVFIPNYIAELKENKFIGPFQTTSFVVTIVLGLFFTILAFLFTDIYLNLFFSGHTDSYYQLVKSQFYYLAPCLVIWGLTALLSGILNIYDEFKYSSFYPVFTSIIMLACLFFFKDVLKEKVLAVGMLLGCLVEFGFLVLVCLKKGILVLAKPDFKSINAKIMLKEFPARITSSFFNGLIPVSDQYFAAQLVIGSIAALNYGFKVPAFLSTIAIIALGNVLLPYFSNLLIDDRNFAYQRLNQILKLVFFGILVVVIPLSLLSYPITQLLYERNAFTASDTQVVSNIQIVYFLALPFSICTDVIVRFLTSINKNRFLALVSILSLILNVVFNYIFMKLYGVMGIALCTSVIEVLKMFIFYWYSNTTKKTMK